MEEAQQIEEKNRQWTKDEKKAMRARFFQYSLKAKKPIVFGLLATALAVFFDLLAPFTIARIVDRELDAASGVSSWKVLFTLLGIFLICTMLAAALRALASYQLESAANRVSQYIQEDLFGHVHRLPIQFFDRLPAGKVVSRVTNDTAAVRNIFIVVLSQLLTAGVFIIGIFIALLSIDVNLFLLSVLTLPIIIIIVLHFRHYSAKYNKDYRRHLSDVNGSLNENIQGMSLIQSLHQEERIKEEFFGINNKVYEDSVKLTKLFSYSSYNATDTLKYLMLGLVLLYFALSSFSGATWVPVGHLYIFIDYMNKLFNQITNVMNRIGDIERAISAYEHIYELLLEEEEKTAGAEIPDLTGDVRFENVRFSYVEDEEVLKDVSFSLKAGESIAFVGSTGSGKSTIMNLLLGFYEAQHGSIYFDGQDMRSLNKNKLREHMAIVLQEPYLFTGTIYSNISMGHPHIDEQRAKQALIELGGRDLLEKLPDGILTEVKEKGNEFSAGERQLISFARALAQDPKILVLDEATASIDSETEHIIQNGIQYLEKGRSTFMIAHRLSTIRDANQIIVMHHGRIAEQGNHEELIAQKGMYWNMYQTQSGTM